MGPVAALGCLTAFGPAAGWRAVFAIGGIPILVAILAIYKLPESSRWLASKDRIREADATVTEMEEQARRRGKVLAPPKIIHIVREKTRFSELFRGIYARRTFVVWTQWFCCYFISNGYATWAPTLYMKMGGLPAKYALAVQIAAGAIQVCFTYLFALTTDQLGRKPWFVGGFSICAINCAVAALVMGVFGVQSWEVLWVFGVLLVISVGPNNLGVYVYTPELYPTRMRAWATATGSSMNRIGSFVAPSIVGFLMAKYGNIGLVFLMMAAVATWGAIVVGVWGEETKRRVLEELSP